MKKNILRVVALLLIVCVLAGFPLKAKATEVAAYAALSVGAQNLIAGLFNACGLGPGGDPQPFYDAVNQCISDLHLGEIIQGVTWAFSGFQRFAVPVTLAEQVRDWLFDSKTIIEFKIEPPSVSYDSFESIYEAAASASHAIFVRNSSNGDWAIGYSDKPLSHSIPSGYSSGYIYYQSDCTFATILRSGWSESVTVYPSNGANRHAVQISKPVTISYFGINDDSSDNGSISVSDGFSSGNIASRYYSITEGYPAWGEGIISVDSSIVDSDEAEPIPYIPVGVGQTLEESAALTQEQAQSGVSTIEVSVEIPDDTVAGTKLSAFFSSLLSALSWTSIKTWIEGIWTSVLSIPDAIANLHSLVLSIPQAIADVLADIFIPAEDYISVKVDALAAEYAFVPDIVNSVTLLKNNLVGDGGPPVIYVDFGRAGGSTNYGGKVLLTDFAWYEEYKPTVDALLSAALWAFFLWRVFLKMPGIIGGESAAVGSAFTSYTRRGRDD